MSKKDYIAVAKVISEAAYHAWLYDEDVEEFAENLTQRMADLFEQENTEFDRDRFLDACRN